MGEVLREWECIVNRVAKSEVGEKMIVCGNKLISFLNEVELVVCNGEEASG